ncbi:unnamed protein product [Rotaria sp. Silwood1]|nr:unnamed protein product [Rotaria sp. Silwood1]CAF1164898.1 unnamed protein product [Rotaria sp. Silwood1]CAF3432260.1 unnamed protein product [Rotaria sp. Silwood1]CAF3494697.1 unnamed protein product [Rotaria sp. Silwood1]CAF4589686.1 unnamed protein product [Rotaria sp. Silwood1]
MEPIKNALNQAGNLVQQAAHSVAEVFYSSETTTDDIDKTKETRNDDEDKNIDSKQNKFAQEQDTNIQKSDIKTSSRAYEDKPQESDAKVLATAWPDLKGKTRHEAQEFIKAKGYSNVKILKKGTSSTTEHDESRVILFVDDNDVVVEEPKVG